MNENNRHYAIVQAGTVVYGVGTTIPEAQADANEWIDGEWTADRVSYQSEYNDAKTFDRLVLCECTKRLYDTVKKSGGDVMFDFDNCVLDLDEE